MIKVDFPAGHGFIFSFAVCAEMEEKNVHDYLLVVWIWTFRVIYLLIYHPAKHPDKADLL